MISISNCTLEWAKTNNLRNWFKPSTTSTNEIAKSEVGDLENFKLYFTEEQSEGRGRGTNTWSNSKPGHAFLSSWTFKLTNPPQHFYPALIGLGLFQACQNTWPGLAWSLKAPNDLFIDDKKVAGLLLELIQQSDSVYLCIGLGFNIFSNPTEVQTSSHLTQYMGQESELTEDVWTQFLESFKTNLDQTIENSTTSKISREQRDQLLVALNSNPWKAETYIDVSDQGDLISETQTISWRDL